MLPVRDKIQIVICEETDEQRAEDAGYDPPVEAVKGDELKIGIAQTSMLDTLFSCAAQPRSGNGSCREMAELRRGQSLDRVLSLLKVRRLAGLPLAFAACICCAQNAQQPAQEQLPITSVRDHWTLFLQETFGPISAAGTVFNAAFSHVTNSDPRYGTNGIAFAQRVGASAADIASQNFFGDFLVASAFHEDPRYVRMGEGHGLWRRFGYAISRAAVIRTASGRNSFNWDNVLGSAMSAGFSNLYYPAPSRTGGAMLIHFGTSVADNGFVNLAPEFWPDFRRKVLRRH